MAITTFNSAIPLLYRLFFLYIEPVATAVGAYYAHFRQNDYLEMTYASSMTGLLEPSTREAIVLSQLANMYAVFALNEALVLRSTSNLTVWKVFLFGLLLADFGHIYSVNALGMDVYWQFWNWNAMYWGNLGFVYAGASMRTAFMLGIGLAVPTSPNKSR